MKEDAKQFIQENREQFQVLAYSDLNSQKWARKLMDSADVSYDDKPSTSSDPSEYSDELRCDICNRRILEGQRARQFVMNIGVPDELHCSKCSSIEAVSV